MALARARVLVVAVTVSLALAGIALGYNLSLSAGRRQARQGVAFVARWVPRVSAYHVGRCRRQHAQVRCGFTIVLRALSGGTITCSSQVTVLARTPRPRRRRAPTRPTLRSRFPQRPRCARTPPRRAG